jgi:hypothetical protein
MDLDAFQKSAKRTLNPELDEQSTLLDAAMGLSE